MIARTGETSAADAKASAAAKRRVEEGLETLRAGLAPYVEKHMRDRHGEGWRRFASRGARTGTDGRRQRREG